MFADFTDLLWAKELPHKDLILAALYHLPGGILVGIGALCVRMILEEILKHISQGLARSKFWTALCIVGWLIVMRTTPVSDAFARKIHWNELFPAAAEEGAAKTEPSAKTGGR